jgi:hypothetical protein
MPTSSQICLLFDNRVSRKHAVVTYHDDAFFFLDLQGINGSLVNGVYAPAGVGVRMKLGDVLTIGSASFMCLALDERFSALFLSNCCFHNRRNYRLIIQATAPEVTP